MPKTESLDELIAKNAAEFADQIKAAAQMADKEEEIRIEAERQLAFIEKQTGIKLEGKHEFTVASGRADSVYDRVIIEYKNPKSPGARIGPKADSPGSKKVVDQLKGRFYDMQTELGHPLNTMFGVGLDGNYFIFIRYRDGKWQVQEPVEVNKYSAERFLWALYNLGQKGKPFSSEYLALDFGAEYKLAQDGVRTLYEAISQTTHPKAQVFFNQWKILFGEVCGYDVDNPSDKIKKLAEGYGIEHRRKLKPAELLFAVHSYYAIFMKLLASEIVAFFNKWISPPLDRMLVATTSNGLKREMEDLEAGSVFRHLNITNFLEGDLFAWYTSVWSEPIEQLVRAMVARLDDYNPGTLSEDPDSSRDLLKKLYQQLFPKSVRHDLGEYYTPDWLAEHVLNELEYVGDPDKRLLDPACGSGTFLVMAINRIRKWYDENREQARFDEGDLCRKILSNVIGFDLNPLAVMAARTNYLIAIRDLVGHVDKVEIPIYLCDSIMTPSDYGGLFTAGLGKAKELKTAATNFIIPTEIATNRDDVAKYAEQLEFCVRNAYSPKEFVERCRDEGLPISEAALHTNLYQELVQLDKANKNGVWARIIKNAFAPLFVGQVDYVAGNPPWVNWESLPEDYRNALKPMWQDYGLFSLSGSAGRLGGGKKDLSMLFVYTSVDNYLPKGGRLGFVITLSIFKTKGAGDGFRQFRFVRNRDSVVVKPIAVHDLSSMQVFEGATNRTSVFICTKQENDFSYPVPYFMWHGPSRVEQDASLRHVKELTEIKRLGAVPVERGNASSPWLTAPRKTLEGIQKVLGQSDYTAYAGVCTWLNGVYCLRVLQRPGDGSLLIENLHDIGKIKVNRVEALIDEDLVYPLLRGRDVIRWGAEPSAHILLVQDPQTRRGIPEAEMRRKYPKTYDYLKRFEPELRKRSGYRQYFKPVDPFYSMYNVGPYTLAPWKVYWTRVATQINAAVAGTNKDLQPLLSIETATFVPFKTAREAHYFAALINSVPCRSVIENYSSKSTGSFGSPHVLTHVAIPNFSSRDPLHLDLASLSQKCHDAATQQDDSKRDSLEAEVNDAAARLWGVTTDELADMGASLENRT
ncbi:MAG: Eco57I restriction-modification methylase domain-containing protein [Pyrinomonadaceae bacterium]